MKYKKANIWVYMIPNNMLLLDIFSCAYYDILGMYTLALYGRRAKI